MINSYVVYFCKFGDINVKLWLFCVEKYYFVIFMLKKYGLEMIMEIYVILFKFIIYELFIDFIKYVVV